MLILYVIIASLVLVRALPKIAAILAFTMRR